MPELKEQLKTLESSIVNRPPVCFGTLPVSASDCDLFYGKSDPIRRLNFVTASQDELKSLSETCERATFGMNQEDVLDESYRKAGKLDPSDFSMRFSAIEAGLLDVVSTELFEGKTTARPIRAELYKLNVYETGSFFKPHIDTPRAKSMFGSLVITFPTKHEGGTLTFRHKGGQWAVDSGKLVSEQAGPCVVYAAFYSDVEHEVLPVKTGCRVTVTYNLYFVAADTPFSKLVGNPIPAHRSALESAFRDLLSDPTVMPNGGRLGFGLHHQYPLDTSPSPYARAARRKKHQQKRAQLEALMGFLKGGDATLKQLCDDLKLRTFLGVVYRTTEKWSKQQDDVLCKMVADIDAEIEDSLVNYLRNYYGGKLLTRSRWRKRDMIVEWVTDSPQVNYVKQQYMAFGNEAELTHTYFRICLFVKIGATGSRETIDDDDDEKDEDEELEVMQDEGDEDEELEVTEDEDDEDDESDNLHTSSSTSQ
ncbi:uncharacterized protein C8Q71DRAFT_302952 [Rhodofomes roseus]|uniref:Fe2OG dioxygenase domain-containing protein n=1 Tax=Rhodofomes roseus TaxID=34475 RepID=A0ABQ8K3J6_9APHY|nr:uncharacterized protein C8Q71DRAFT_302952 [Rhodofomes roseus]KAH9831417.1 hypothetical protein C8Q71DRAFT_302952 [Rhodofomes roseus]